MDPKPSEAPKPSGATEKKNDDASEFVDCEDDEHMVLQHELSELIVSYDELKEAHDELKKRYEELAKKYDGLNKENKDIYAFLSCLKNKSLEEEEDASEDAEALEEEDAASEGAEPEAKRPKVDKGVRCLYNMWSELEALREAHSDLNGRYAQDMAANADDHMKLRVNYEKYIKYMMGRFNELKQPKPEKVLLTNVHGLPLHVCPNFNKKCLWCYKDKDVEDWDPEFASCRSCSEKLWWMKIPHLPV